MEVTGDTRKDIILSGPTITPTPIPTPTPKPTPSYPVLNLQLHPRLDGKTQFTNEKVHSSPKSVRLIIPKDADQDSFAMALYPNEGTLHSLGSFSIFASYTHASPRFMLCLDTRNLGWANTFLLSENIEECDGTWKAISPGDSWTITNIEVTQYGAEWKTLESWTNNYSDAKVLFIGILIDYSTISPEGLDEPLYADELTLDGVTYQIAPYIPPPTSSPGPTITPPVTVTPMPTNPTNSPTPEFNDGSNPAHSPTPTTPIKTESYITISADAHSAQIGSTIIINGMLLDINGKPLTGKTINLLLKTEDDESWKKIGSGLTNLEGKYNIPWNLTATGSFNFKSEWEGNTDYLEASNLALLSFLPSQDQNIFCVESNSTITELKFDSSTSNLSFKVEGPSGTTGFTKTSIAKTLVVDNEIEVFLDGKELNFDLSSSEEYWTITFDYFHSAHQVTVKLSQRTKITSETEAGIPGLPIWLVIVSAVVIASAATTIIIRRRRISTLT